MNASKIKKHRLWWWTWYFQSPSIWARLWFLDPVGLSMEEDVISKVVIFCACCQSCLQSDRQFFFELTYRYRSIIMVISLHHFLSLTFIQCPWRKGEGNFYLIESGVSGLMLDTGCIIFKCQKVYHFYGISITYSKVE